MSQILAPLDWELLVEVDLHPSWCARFVIFVKITSTIKFSRISVGQREAHAYCSTQTKLFDAIKIAQNICRSKHNRYAYGAQLKKLDCL